MITPYIQTQFVEKILISKNGERYRVLFLVTLMSGEMTVKIVSAKQIFANSSMLLVKGSSDETKDNQPFFLPGKTIHQLPTTNYQKLFTVSPYFSLDFLINSQPTRAPAK